MEGDELRTQAAKAAADAVRLDANGEAAAAAKSYEEAAQALTKLLDAGLVREADKESIQSKIKQYTSRAEQLKTAELAKSIPDVPGTTPEEKRSESGDADDKGAPVASDPLSEAAAAHSPRPPAGPPPTTGQKGQVAAKGDSYVVNGLQTAAAMAVAAKDFDERYQVTTKISEAAKSTYEGAKSLEEDYQISQKVVDGAKSAAVSVQKAEEDYQISTRIKEGAVQAYNRTWELERQYEVRERFWEAMQDGWEALKSAGEKASEYEKEYQLSEKAQAALQQSYETASEYVNYGIEYLKGQQSRQAVSYPSFPRNADV